MQWFSRKGFEMSGIDLIADTNVLIYLLDGRKEAEILNGFSIGISVITELELLSKKRMKSEELTLVKDLIKSCVVLEIEDGIKECFFQIKQIHQMKLPDAVIAATAIFTGLPLVTSDIQFAQIEELNLIEIQIT
jgi:predicted nucleic acid-binding protein